MSGFDGNGTFACLSEGYLDLPPDAHTEPGFRAHLDRDVGFVQSYLLGVVNALYQRFESKIDHDDATGCWNWTGTKDSHGYGRFSFFKAPRQAYRVAYEMYIGPIPKGQCLDHLCRNRTCVNPYHLEPVSIAENTRRGKMRERQLEWSASKTECKRGHPLIQLGRQRGCRVCINDRRRDLRKLIGVGMNLAGLKLGAAASVAARRKIKAENQ